MRFESANIKDQNLIAIKNLYIGSLAGVKGDYLKYNKLILESKDRYSPGLYWQVNSIVSDYDYGINEECFLKINNNILLNEIENFSYVMSISCDQNYFNLYAEYFIKSIFKNTKKPLVHIYIVNPLDIGIIRKKIKEWVGDNSEYVLTNFFDCPTHIDFRPISAVLRLLIINDLLVKYKKPVFLEKLMQLF